MGLHGAASPTSAATTACVTEQRAKRWERYSGEDLAGRTMVLIGAGDLARGCARLARAIDMRVIAVARDPARPRAHAALFDAVMPSEELEIALGMADVVVMTAPHTKQTEGCWTRPPSPRSAPAPCSSISAAAKPSIMRR